MQKTILVVDDDKSIVRLVKSYLEREHYRVLEAYEGVTALQILRREAVDLIVLDLMMPQRDGWDVTRTIRSDSRLQDIPIIMLTARIQDSDKILGLELGADDYVTKPFNPREMTVRVKTVLRRTNPEKNTNLLKVGDITMQIESRKVTVGDEKIDLTPTEFALLKTLLTNPNIVFSRSELIEQSLGYDYESIERTLDSHIRNLRRKIEPNEEPKYIQTVFGIGYKLEG